MEDYKNRLKIAKTFWKKKITWKNLRLLMLKTIKTTDPQNAKPQR